MGVGRKTDVGVGDGAGAGVGVLAGRGATGTGPLSSTGPSADGVGAGVADDGSWKSCAELCAASGAVVVAARAVERARREEAARIIRDSNLKSAFSNI